MMRRAVLFALMLCALAAPPAPAAATAIDQAAWPLLAGFLRR